jgi:murein DD-endopeptidase MepM/ murein hydrolase activator NlpD
MELFKLSTRKIIIILTLAITLYAGFHLQPPPHKTPVISATTHHSAKKTVPHTALKSGHLPTTFTQVAQQESIPRPVIYAYLHLFSNVINFAHNVHPHDYFKILYSTKPQQTPHILAAEFQQRHHTYRAIYYPNTKHPGYYTTNGESLNGKYLIAPLTYKYISSPYSLHRKDPITHRIQPHYGVDYAAPTGTPIHSVGNGRIIYKGWINGYGNTVKIRYTPSTYGLYAHLSHFSRIHFDEKIKKGETIGYVGATGWATGPHLHFGWYVHNKPQNPVLRPFVPSNHIPLAQLPSFKTYCHTVLSQLDPKNPRQTA